MDSNYYFVGRVRDLKLAQLLTIEQFSMLTMLGATELIDIWSLEDQMFTVSHLKPGVSNTSTPGSNQILVKTVHGNTFFPVRYTNNLEQTRLATLQLQSDDREIAFTLSRSEPYVDVDVFYKAIRKICEEETKVEKEYRIAEIVLAQSLHRKRIESLCEQYILGCRLFHEDFAELLAEYRIWETLPEDTMERILNFWFYVDRTGKIFSNGKDPKDITKDNENISQSARLLTQQIQDYPLPATSPKNKTKE